MNPIAMAALILGLLALFAWSANRRWILLRVGSPTHESRTTQLGDRLKAVWTFAFRQKKLKYYLTAGFAHQFIFLGFMILLARPRARGLNRFITRALPTNASATTRLSTSRS